MGGDRPPQIFPINSSSRTFLTLRTQNRINSADSLTGTTLLTAVNLLLAFHPHKLVVEVDLVGVEETGIRPLEVELQALSLISMSRMNHRSPSLIIRQLHLVEEARSLEEEEVLPEVVRCIPEAVFKEVAVDLMLDEEATNAVEGGAGEIGKRFALPHMRINLVAELFYNTEQSYSRVFRGHISSVVDARGDRVPPPCQITTGSG